MGRKNGKTALASAIELDLLINDDEGAPEVYNVATAHDQAAKGFNNAWRMVMTSPALAKHVRKRVSDLYCGLNMGSIKRFPPTRTTLTAWTSQALSLTSSQPCETATSTT